MEFLFFSWHTIEDQDSLDGAYRPVGVDLENIKQNTTECHFESNEVIKEIKLGANTDFIYRMDFIGDGFETCSIGNINGRITNTLSHDGYHFSHLSGFNSFQGTTKIVNALIG